MKVVTQSEFEALFRKQSVVLSRPANDPKRAPKFFQVYDFSRRGIEQMLDERLNKVDGSLAFYREEVRQHLKSWEIYRSRQVNKLPQPVGLWAENLARSRAKVAICEAECRALQASLREALAKESQEQKAVHRHPRGALKWRDGKPYSCDGRMLTVDGEGTARFKDDGTPLDTYLDDLKQAKIEKTLVKQRAARERRERIHAAMGIEPKRHRTPLRAGG